MNLRLTILTRFFPTRIKLRMLDELTGVTAEGFRAEPPDWGGTSFESRLARYARFTAHEAEGLVRAGDDIAVEAARARLHAGARRLGGTLRRRLGLRDVDDAFAAFRLFYRQMGIEVSGGPLGEMRVERCFFSRYYTETACSLVSALDQGLVDGLFGGASLEFHERLTGSGRCCCATLALASPRSPATGIPAGAKT